MQEESEKNFLSRSPPSQPLIHLINSSLPSSTIIQPPCIEHPNSPLTLTPPTTPTVIDALSSKLSSIEATSHGDSKTDFDELDIEYVEFLGVGTVLGDTEILEKQCTHALVTCETVVDAFSLEHSELEYLMMEYPVLEERLWRIRGVSVATKLLKETVEYKVRVKPVLTLAGLTFFVSPHELLKNSNNPHNLTSKSRYFGP